MQTIRKYRLKWEYVIVTDLIDREEEGEKQGEIETIGVVNFKVAMAYPIKGKRESKAIKWIEEQCR